MIPATEAIQLVEISTQDRDEVRATVLLLDAHVRKHMTFGGPTPYEIPFRLLSKTASQILCYVMKRLKWSVTLTLIAEQPRFQGMAPTPHHWVIQLSPASEIYDTLLADFEFDKPQLM